MRILVAIPDHFKPASQSLQRWIGGIHGCEKPQIFARRSGAVRFPGPMLLKKRDRGPISKVYAVAPILLLRVLARVRQPGAPSPGGGCKGHNLARRSRLPGKNKAPLGPNQKHDHGDSNNYIDGYFDGAHSVFAGG